MSLFNYENLKLGTIKMLTIASTDIQYNSDLCRDTALLLLSSKVYILEGTQLMLLLYLPSYQSI